MGTIHETDDLLMVRTRQGDRASFDTLVIRHRDGLVNYLTHLTRSRDRAEELAQEAFIRLYEKSHRYKPQGRLAPYLYRIATNLFRSDTRRLKRWQLLVAGFLVSDSSPQASPQNELLSCEIEDKVTVALSALPVSFRAAVILREIEGWSYEEIAQTLGCSLGTVKSRISRGRDILRTSLQGYWIRLEKTNAAG